MLRRFFGPIERITLGVVSLTVSIILLATFLGVFPDTYAEKAEARKIVCESAAMSFSSMANKIDPEAVEKYFLAIIKRQPEIVSIGLREADGTHVLEVGPHFQNWSLESGDNSSCDEIRIPIYGEHRQWGAIEFHFTPLMASGIEGMLNRTEIKLAQFVILGGFFVFYAYLRFVLRQLNPSKVIPNRVRDALDTLAEGLVVMDKDERIVLANKAFESVTGRAVEDVVGKNVSSLEFADSERKNGALPWETALAVGESQCNSILKSKQSDGMLATFSVSCAPIFDDKGYNQGAIASFEDVTQLENKKNELQRMLVELDASTIEIRRQNKELEFLAKRDPLTGSMNRRSFFEIFERVFTSAAKHDEQLSAFMVDIDHFKSINDNHGHAKGDEVLREVAKTLEDCSRENDVVCRYGGEEFAILLPATTIAVASNVAERIRSAIEKLKPGGLEITTSIGVSAISLGASTPQDLLEDADKCLYVAKRNGRNQVVRWDQVDDDIEVDEASVSRTPVEPTKSSIPFYAVTALISALAYRDQESANHSRRVADLCVAVAEGLLPMRDCYFLEIAGLLHDIGKIGVPDSILLKPGPLSTDDWQILHMHERIGFELIRTTFDHEELNSIIQNMSVSHQRRINERINVPLGARILSIVDAYDSMVRDTPYRKGIPQRQAFQELRDCAGEQFDPELVERVIQILRIHKETASHNEVQLSKTAALNVGLQIEQLSEAIDNRDKPGIRAIATRLQETAAKHGGVAISEKANVIVNELREDTDLYELIHATNELLDECRIAQRAIISVLPGSPTS